MTVAVRALKRCPSLCWGC